MNYKYLFESKIIRASLLILLFLFCIGANIFVRLAPAYFPSKQIEAVNIVDKEILDEATKTANDKFPLYNKQTKKKIAEKIAFNEKNNDEDYYQRIDEEYYDLVDEYQDESGLTYFIGCDTYQWVRKTENVLKYGHPGTSIKDGKPYDDYMLAPVGMPSEEVCSLFYISTFLYKTVKIIYPDLELKRFLFYLPIFYALVFLVLLYSFMWRFISPLAGFIATWFVGLHYRLIRRTAVGWYEYDILSLIVPLLTVWFTLLALKNKDNLTKLIIYSSAAALAQVFFVITWLGWWFIFLVICGVLATLILLALYKLHKHKSKEIYKKYIRSVSTILILFIGLSALFTFIFLRMNLIGLVLFHIKDNLLGIGSVFQQNIYPNTYIVVSELQPMSLRRLAANVYGLHVFLVSILALVWCLFTHKKDKLNNLVIIFLFWFLFMYFSTLKATRFIIYLLVPLGVYIGIFAEDIKKKISEKAANKNLKIKFLSFVLVSGLIIALLYVVSVDGLGGVQKVEPKMNDSWYEALTYLKENSPKESIINSRWGYGDIYKYFADRRVIVDGHTQKNPVVYWLSIALISNNEEESLRILRMINNASDTTYKKINKTVADPFEAQVLLEQLLSVDKNKADELLIQSKVPQKDRKSILSDLYGQPDPGYFIADESMAEAIVALTFSGNWNFARVYAYKNRQRPKDEVTEEISAIFSLDSKQARVAYDEVTIVKPDLASLETFSETFGIIGEPKEADRIDGVLYFDNGIIFYPKTKEALIYLKGAGFAGYKKVKNVFVTEKNKLKKYSHEDGESTKGVWIFKRDDKYFSLIMKDDLMDSLFARLVYLKGRGLENFSLFYEDEKAGIYIYKINWEI
jgi:dolichyl-diphosphooligosaccharide--protein glycosyltransferase